MIIDNEMKSLWLITEMELLAVKLLNFLVIIYYKYLCNYNFKQNCVINFMYDFVKKVPHNIEKKTKY